MFSLRSFILVRSFVFVNFTFQQHDIHSFLLLPLTKPSVDSYFCFKSVKPKNIVVDFVSRWCWYNSKSIQRLRNIRRRKIFGLVLFFVLFVYLTQLLVFISIWWKNDVLLSLFFYSYTQLKPNKTRRSNKKSQHVQAVSWSRRRWENAEWKRKRNENQIDVLILLLALDNCQNQRKT